MTKLVGAFGPKYAALSGGPYPPFWSGLSLTYRRHGLYPVSGLAGGRLCTSTFSVVPPKQWNEDARKHNVTGCTDVSKHSDGVADMTTSGVHEQQDNKDKCVANCMDSSLCPDVLYTANSKLPKKLNSLNEKDRREPINFSISKILNLS